MSERADFSAETVAAARALAARESDVLVRNPDYVAQDFLGARYRWLARLPFAPHMAAALWRRKIPGIYEYLNARTHHIDRVLAEEVQSGAQQVVVLGAGYDSRACRLRAVLSEVRVFEVDQPGTQARKLAIFRARFGSVPRHVRYVAHDFRTGSAFPRLAQSGYDRALRTVFLWEGVAYYLPADDVDSLLADVRANAGPNSAIVFDYLYSGALRGEAGLYGAAGAKAFLEGRKQPYRSGIERGAGAEFMAARGYDVVTDLTPEQMQERYLRRIDGSVSHRIFGGYGMMHARLRAM